MEASHLRDKSYCHKPNQSCSLFSLNTHFNSHSTANQLARILIIGLVPGLRWRRRVKTFYKGNVNSKEDIQVFSSRKKNEKKFRIRSVNGLCISEAK